MASNDDSDPYANFTRVCIQHVLHTESWINGFVNDVWTEVYQVAISLLTHIMLTKKLNAGHVLTKTYNKSYPVLSRCNLCDLCEKFV